MSLYNMLCGVKPATFFILPMLGKHPDAYPRFRDCFLSDPDHPEYDRHIHVYTRTGGGNRAEYEAENQAMRETEGFVADFDDSYDCTYASWVFKVPERWQYDFDRIEAGQVKMVSDAYRAQMVEVYPTLRDKIYETFGEPTETE